MYRKIKGGRERHAYITCGNPRDTNDILVFFSEIMNRGSSSRKRFIYFVYLKERCVYRLNVKRQDVLIELIVNICF